MVDEEIGYETVRRIPFGPLERIVLKPSTLYFSFDFTLPDYSAGGERRYQTFLEGFDLGWSASSASPSVRYARLHPGDYTFKLRAFDTAGRISPEILEVPITVLKPWYEQYWFYLSSVLLISLLIIAYIRSRLARLRKELEAERKLQSLELRSLRQQINPHFISNAMNAIREYVRREDAENPTKYLTDFSLMMRQFLESSRHSFTPVGKEMDMLQRYVGLEQLRFPDIFTAEFYIDPAIDPDMDEVPSLLLQPLVENAIEHGLCALEGGGKLRVSIELDPLDDDVLVCTVSDNGVGRGVASRSTRRPGHTSRATQILEDRCAVLERDDRVKLSVTTEDLNVGLEHSGTVVTVRIEGN
jgi:LytS/YehU family sensor histidine kinase